MTRSSLVSYSAIIAVLLAGTYYLAVEVLQLDRLRHSMHVTVLMRHSGGLAVDSPVLARGIEVGSVTAVRTAQAGVEIRIRLDEGTSIPTESAVRVESLSALGEPYVDFAVSTRSGPFIGDGDVLDRRSSPTPGTIPDAAVRMVGLLDQLDPAVLTSLSATLSDSVVGVEATLPQLRNASALLAATVLSRTASLRQLIADMQTIGADMAWVGPALAEAGPEWDELGDWFGRSIVESGALADKRAPDAYTEAGGIGPFVTALDDVLNTVGPEAKSLVPILGDIAAAGTRALAQIDISRLISLALGTVAEDGAIRIQVGVK